MNDSTVLSIDIIIPAYNAEDDIGRTIQRIVEQQQFDHLIGSIIVVDDASIDHTSEVVTQLAHPKICLVVNETNFGRSKTRNIGAKLATSNLILFVDADCQLVGDDVFCELDRQWKAGSRLIFGYATSIGHCFWDSYQKELAERRVRSRDQLQQTSACFACDRVLFERSGGFSEEYVKYGFEDRDLIIRLFQNIEASAVSFNASITAVHRNPDSLAQLTSKLYEAGRYTSATFRAKYPAEYLKMAFSRCDARIEGIKIFKMAAIISPFWQAYARLLENFVSSESVPFWLKKMIVKGVSAIAYFEGTRASNNK